MDQQQGKLRIEHSGAEAALGQRGARFAAGQPCKVLSNRSAMSGTSGIAPQQLLPLPQGTPLLPTFLIVSLRAVGSVTRRRSLPRPLESLATSVSR